MRDLPLYGAVRLQRNEGGDKKEGAKTCTPRQQGPGHQNPDRCRRCLSAGSCPSLSGLILRSIQSLQPSLRSTVTVKELSSKVRILSNGFSTSATTTSVLVHWYCLSHERSSSSIIRSSSSTTPSRGQWRRSTGLTRSWTGAITPTWYETPLYPPLECDSDLT